MSERATLTEGQWFMYQIDQGIPSTVTVYTGEVEKRRALRKISRMQALALCRWHGHDGLYYAYRDGNGRMIDVHVVGDIDAWMGEPDPEPPVPHCPVCGDVFWGDWCDTCYAANNPAAQP